MNCHDCGKDSAVIYKVGSAVITPLCDKCGAKHKGKKVEAVTPDCPLCSCFGKCCKT